MGLQGGCLLELQYDFQLKLLGAYEYRHWYFSNPRVAAAQNPKNVTEPESQEFTRKKSSEMGGFDRSTIRPFIWAAIFAMGLQR